MKARGLFIAFLGLLLPAHAVTAVLPFETMMTGGAPGLINNSCFLPRVDSQAAKEEFIGTLEIEGAEMSTAPAQFSSRKVLGKDPKIFPPVKLSFFTAQGDLVPTTQEIIRVGSTAASVSYWDILVQPGRVWSEPGDHGWSRAAFPFELVNSIEGETHNGVATFLYKKEKVSRLRYQIVQQTAPYYVTDYFTAWGSLHAHVRPDALTNLAELKKEYADEVHDRVSIGSWADLAAKAGQKKLEGFDSAMPPDELLLSGLYDDNTLYLKSTRSAAGPLPYIDRMRFGVWSVTKSAVTTVALLRLAQKFGPEVFDAKIADYVHPTVREEDWKNVTFGDALNMATGIGNGSDKREPNVIFDPLDQSYAKWYEARSLSAKIDTAFHTGKKYPWKPGEVARYRDQDMFLLGVAMDRYLKAKEGAGADIGSMLLKEVYEPIGIQVAPMNRTIEPDGGPGQPIMAYGFYPTLSDLVKIARLYQDHGRHAGVQILHEGRLLPLLAGPAIRGLPTGDKNKFGELRYYMGFWHAPFRTVSGENYFLPEMDGYGGNYVVLMPDHLIALRLAKCAADYDAMKDIFGMAAVSDAIAPFPANP